MLDAAAFQIMRHDMNKFDIEAYDKNLSEISYGLRGRYMRILADEPDVIVCNSDALFLLDYFTGYLTKPDIDVFAAKKGENSILNYILVDSLDGIETAEANGMRCSSLNYTVNYMLRHWDSADEAACVEAMANYYYENNESFEGLVIQPENQPLFANLNDWIIHCFDIL
jgi:hypothetical protein